MACTVHVSVLHFRTFRMQSQHLPHALERKCVNSAFSFKPSFSKQVTKTEHKEWLCCSWLQKAEIYSLTYGKKVELMAYLKHILFLGYPDVSVVSSRLVTIFCSVVCCN